MSLGFERVIGGYMLFRLILQPDQMNLFIESLPQKGALFLVKTSGLTNRLDAARQDKFAVKSQSYTIQSGP